MTGKELGQETVYPYYPHVGECGFEYPDCLTKRELFAAMIMPHTLAMGEFLPRERAALAVECADMLLETLAEVQP